MIYELPLSTGFTLLLAPDADGHVYLTFERTGSLDPHPSHLYPQEARALAEALLAAADAVEALGG